MQELNDSPDVKFPADRSAPAVSEQISEGPQISQEPKKSRRTWKEWKEILPGSRRDYFLIFLTIVDLFQLSIKQAYGEYFDKRIITAMIAFDLMVIAFWLLDTFNRLRKEKNKVDYLKRNWYEILGMIPIFIFRPLLLLRAVKLTFAFYKLGRSDQDVSRILTRDITFRFRDIIVDTIADAVFLQSLQRVDEVMKRLDYAKLAQQAFQENSDELKKAVHDSLYSKSVIGDLAKLPFMNTIGQRLGEDLSQVIMEILETEVTGEIMKSITGGILKEMSERVKRLDIERITGKAAVIPAGGELEKDEELT